MKRLVSFLIIGCLGAMASTHVFASGITQVTLPPTPQQGMGYQQTTPPSPSEPESSSKDSLQTETPLESFFNGVIEWLYEPEPETQRQKQSRTQQQQSQQRQQGSQKQKVSIWQ